MQTVYILLCFSLLLNILSVYQAFRAKKHAEKSDEQLSKIRCKLGEMDIYLLSFKGYVESVLENKP